MERFLSVIAATTEAGKPEGTWEGKEYLRSSRLQPLPPVSPEDTVKAGCWPQRGEGPIKGSKESACNVGDLGLIPGSGRFPGGGNGNPLQDSCLENPWTEEPGRLQSMGSQSVGHD